MSDNKQPLNQILYGPPGTGKTYNTINKALKIINEKEEQELNWKDRKAVKEQYNERVKEGRIVFTTFHQSMSYEDFIEGIKPIEPNGKDKYLKYKTQNGILKDFCNKIEGFEKPHGSQLTIEETIGNYDQLYSAFIEHLKEKIANLNENKFLIFESRGSKVQLIKIEDNSLSTKGAKARTEVIIMKGKLERIYKRYKSPDEITNIGKQLRREVGTDIGWTTNYFAVFKALKEFETSIKTNISKGVPIAKKKNYVLIIDEINRGNVSQIFGELITLIEDDKRLGAEEALKITLPYSKKTFGVPPNLYIVATMNTADRSVEALDTALRRRFSFTEVISNPEKLKDNNFEGINLQKMLTAINNRLEVLLSKDHTIGHAWLMNVYSLEELQKAFKNKILPLLQEFFYNDYAKIGLVLGKEFVIQEKSKKDKTYFAAFNDSEEMISDYIDKIIYSLKEVSGMKAEAFKSIYSDIAKQNTDNNKEEKKPTDQSKDVADAIEAQPIGQPSQS